MPSRICPDCKKVMPSTEYEAHRRWHRDQKSERKGGSRAWRAIREAVLMRDGYACTVCGSEEELEVDHIDGDWRNDDPENLRTVCFDHNPRGRKRSAD